MKEVILACLLTTGAGDNNNIRGIATELKTHIAINEFLEVNAEADPQDLINNHPDAQFILLSSGKDGYEKLIALKNNNPNIKTYWSGHQFFDYLAEPNIKPLDAVILPEYAVNHQQKFLLEKFGTKLIKTVAVPHNVRKEDLEAEYNKLSEQITDEPPYIVVILSGDAQDPKGLIQHYTQNEAREFAKYIASIAGNKIVMVTNGPRTGRFDPQSIQPVIINDHKLETQIDSVSQAFIDQLSESRTRFKFFDFKLGLPVSHYKALLYLIAKTQESYVYLPGESTSMISEALDNLDPSRIIVYETGSMNINHENHVKKLGVTKLSKSLELQEAWQNNINCVPTSDAKKVAEAIAIQLDRNLNDEKGRY